MRSVLIAVGAILTAFGLLFVGQGLGWVRWPASSFMIDQYTWVLRGSVVAATGLVVILVARRARR